MLNGSMLNTLPCERRTKIQGTASACDVLITSEYESHELVRATQNAAQYYSVLTTETSCI